MQKRQCNQCSKTFHIIAAEADFYKRMAVPEPSHCPDCRMQRRFAYRNERALYSDKCDLCGKSIISIFSPEKPNPVYCHECYYSDNWDPTEYGREFDFSRSFFEQFYALQQIVPQVNLIKESVENCEYVNTIGYSKNCYLIFGSVNCEDCYYGTPYYSKNCVDSLYINKCELCYECVSSENLYNCLHCQDCYDSNNLTYCYDVRGSSDLIGCVGLRNQKYQVFNKQYTQPEFDRYKEKFTICDPEQRVQLEKNFNKLKAKHPRRFMMGVQNENVIGNYLNHSKAAYFAFGANRVDNVGYVAQIFDCKDVYDCNHTEDGELGYELSGANRLTNSLASVKVWAGNNLEYSNSCNNSSYLFGCVSMHGYTYAILNKKYSETEYNNLRQQIITHMIKSGEWGEFFPIQNSQFFYNETIAQEYFPITKEIAHANGWPWKEKEEKDYQPQKYRVVNDIQKVSEDICRAVLACKECKKNYTVIPQELAFYKQLNIPIPKYCPDCRHLARVRLRTPLSVWQRQCMCTIAEHSHPARCPIEFSTAYSPEGKELVFCEQCYAAAVN